MFTEHDLLPRANEWLRMAKHVCAIAVVLCLSELRGDSFLLGGGRSTPLCPTSNLKPKCQRPTSDLCTSTPAPSFSPPLRAVCGACRAVRWTWKPWFEASYVVPAKQRKYFLHHAKQDHGGATHHVVSQRRARLRSATRPLEAWRWRISGAASSLGRCGRSPRSCTHRAPRTTPLSHPQQWYAILNTDTYSSVPSPPAGIHR